MGMKESIEIINKKDCSGCCACLNICPKNIITMEIDSEGFYYPNVDYKKCSKCGLCKKVCPIINKINVKNHPHAFACINKDEDIRMKSSSGGIFTIIAEYVIDNGGVVFGAGFDNDFQVIHSYVEKKEELDKFRGSKYVQSKIGFTYKEAKAFLDQGRQVLFTGTPCQIAGLKSYLQKNYDNLICVDFVCHGVPSPKVWRKYILYRERSAGLSVQKITFRNKDEGWKRFSVSFLFNDNTKYQQTLSNDLYMRAFLKNVSLRPSCYDCKFKTLHRRSDITLADFWGIQNIMRELDDDKGTSLVFINSTKGEFILDYVKQKILYKEVDINQAVAFNPAAIKSVPYNYKRNDFFKYLDQKPFDILVKKYCDEKIYVKLERKIKQYLHQIHNHK